MPVEPYFCGGFVRIWGSHRFHADFTQIFLQDVLGGNYLTVSFNHWLKNANPIAKPNLCEICAKNLRKICAKPNLRETFVNPARSQSYITQQQ